MIYRYICLVFSSFYHGDSNSNPSSEKIIANVMQVTCGTLGLSTATVKLISADGKEHEMPVLSSSSTNWNTNDAIHSSL